MGGAMALHLACRNHPEVGGVFALSSFLNKDSVVYQVTLTLCRLTPITAIPIPTTTHSHSHKPLFGEMKCFPISLCVFEAIVS